MPSDMKGILWVSGGVNFDLSHDELVRHRRTLLTGNIFAA